MNSVLTAAAKEPKLKRFVYTSSIIAAANQPASVPSERMINESSWNTADPEIAWGSGPDNQQKSMAVYATSKLEAEQTAWKFVKEHKPGFVLNTVLPSLCIGPKIFKGQNPSSSNFVQGLYTRDEGTLQFWEGFPPTWSNDIRDAASAHVSALLEPDVVGKRIIFATEPATFTGFINTLKKIDTERKDWPALPETEAVDRTKTDTSLALDLLKRQGKSNFIFMEASIRDQIAAW